MKKNLKTYFQDIHYNRLKPNIFLSFGLRIAELFYKTVILAKNELYKKEILKEQKVNAYVICIGNLTTGGVGKTPIVAELAKKLSKEKKVAIISRGYGAKLSNKEPNIIRDFSEIKFKNGNLCGDEPYQLAKKLDNAVIITCANRVKASNFAIEKYGVEIIILDDGFSNRTIKKDETIIVVDSKMRFGNGHLLPLGPLREPIERINEADKIIVVDKGDNEIKNAIDYFSQFNKPINLCKMKPRKIYNLLTKAEVKIIEKQNIIAFCAIGQPEQFYNFVNQFYNIVETVSFADHHKYSLSDINYLIKLAKKHNISNFITTQKDETKLKDLISATTGYNFNVLELENTIE